MLKNGHSWANQFVRVPYLLPCLHFIPCIFLIHIHLILSVLWADRNKCTTVSNPDVPGEYITIFLFSIFLLCFLGVTWGMFWFYVGERNIYSICQVEKIITRLNSSAGL